MAKKRQKARKKLKIYSLKIAAILVLILLTIGFYYIGLKPNLNIRADYCYFHIPKNASAASVYDSLKSQKLLKSNFDFWLLQNILKYDNPSEGLYQLKRGWGNFWLIYKLKAGSSSPYFSYQIPEYRSRDNTIKSICRQAGIEITEFREILKDSILLSQEFGLNPESIYCVFLPGNYKTYIGRSSKELLTDIYCEYRLFWNQERRRAAKKIKQTPEEVIKLASIVYAETKNKDEMPIIAGLYLNRLRKNIHLQADPTLVFARKTSGLKRVYFKFIESSSPYNTYKHRGLPPGPIGPAPLVAIDAVLNPTKHNYLFFCAKEDLSGCHYFSEDFEQHKLYAKRYRNMLDNKRIK